IMTRAPSLPRTPLSMGLGLAPLPFLLDRNPSMPDGFGLVGFVGEVVVPVAAIFDGFMCDQDPVPSRTTCTPPPTDWTLPPPLALRAGIPGGGGTLANPE